MKKISIIAMKFRKTFLVLALTLCPLLVGGTFAQNVPAFLTQTGTGLTTFSIMQGGTFSLDLNIDVSFTSTGITYFYMTGNNGSGLFALTSRIVTGSPYPDLTTADSTVFSGGNPLLDPVNNNDLGATDNQGETDPPGMYFISTITFSSTAPVGTYTIFLDPSFGRGIVSDDQFNDHPLDGNTITVNVVPEPATVGLALLGGGIVLLGLRARRRA